MPSPRTYLQVARPSGMSKRRSTRRSIGLERREPVKPENWLILADIAEFLRYPRETLVVIVMGDDPAWEVLSFPLPPRDDALSCRVLAAMVASEVTRVSGAHHILLATFSASAPVRAFENMQFTVSVRVHKDEVHLAGSFYVSPAGWGSYTCDDPECAGPLPLSDLAEGAAMVASMGD